MSASRKKGKKADTWKKQPWGRTERFRASLGQHREPPATSWSLENHWSCLPKRGRGSQLWNKEGWVARALDLVRPP